MFIYYLVVVFICVLSVECGTGNLTHSSTNSDISQDSNELGETEIPCDAIRNLVEQSASVERNETENDVKSNSTIDVSDGKYQDSSNNVESSEHKSSIIDYPYTVSVKRKGAHYATGALVDKTWVLTVAREFYNAKESMKLFQVLLGSVDCKRGGTLNAIKVIEVHPKFVPGKPSYDLSLLKLAWSVTPSLTIKPITISKIEAKVISAQFHTTYWPRIVINGTVLPINADERVKHTNLRTSTQNLIPWLECREDLEKVGVKLDISSLCLNPVTMYHSKCLPDPGAPVVSTDGLWGITSGWVSSSCSDVQSPTIFTRVSTPQVRSWIETHIMI